MTVQTLIPTMHQTDFSILDKMNIQTDAIVVNQCDTFSKDVFEHRGRQIEFYSLPERGIGQSRNFSLMRASGDIVLFADDDVRYYDGYEEMIIKAFEENPDADMIAFNLDFKGGTRKRTKIQKNKRIRWFNCGRYGAPRMAVKLESARRHNLCFSLLFGGGARYSAGEDVIFANQAVKSGMHFYAVPITVAEIDDSTSTWFEGNNAKLFYDKGALFAAINPKTAVLRSIRFAIRYSNLCKEELTVADAFKLMLKGSSDFKNNR